MGVNIKQVAFGALALAAVLLPLRKESSVVNPVQPAGGETQRLAVLSTKFRSAHYSWTAFDLRDSAANVMTKMTAGTPQPVIAFRGFATATPVLGVEAAVNELWQHVGPDHPEVHVALLVYNGDPYRQPMYAGTMITRTGARIDCVAIAPAWLGRTEVPREARRNLRDALAPCALLGAFGAPGAGVGSWLDSTRYAAAQSNAWIMPDTIPGEWHAGPWVEWNDTRSGDDWSGETVDRLQSIGALDVAAQLRPPYDYGATGLRCLTGNQEACVRGVLHPAITLPASAIMPPELTLTDWWTPRPAIVDVSTVRPPSASMVSAMITEFGRERFQKFWASNLPFEAAFQDAFGQSLGAWTVRWAQQKWLGTFEAQKINSDILLGVTVRPSSLPVIAIWTTVALMIAAWVARRRTA